MSCDCLCVSYVFLWKFYTYVLYLVAIAIECNLSLLAEICVHSCIPCCNSKRSIGTLKSPLYIKASSVEDE